MEYQTSVERHPFPPFLPTDAKLLIMGTFPPGKHRWVMDFYYPNPTNDFWKIMGLIFYSNPNRLYNPKDKAYDQPQILRLMTDKGIALSDTGVAVRRLKGNASDKYLEITEERDVKMLLGELPKCVSIASTGEKAAQIIANQTLTVMPKIGEYVDWFTGHKTVKIFRMPSTSRAYPLALDKKAAYYRQLFVESGIDIEV